METEEAIQLHGTKRRVEAIDADLSGSAFTDVNLSSATFTDVNLAGATIENADLSRWRVRNVNLSKLHINTADLRHAVIEDSLLDGMTINGIAVAELLAAHRILNSDHIR
ncbi:MAG: pentapeptide repeat-containing protein [Terracidiphilus sp.]